MHCDFLKVDSIKDLAKTVTTDTPQALLRADHLILLIGTNEMLNGSDGYSTAMAIIRLSKTAQEKLKIPISIFQMPPVADPKHIATVALINAKLRSAASQSASCQINVIELKTKMSTHLKSQILSDNGLSLSSQGVDLLISAMTDQVSPVKCKKHEKDGQLADENVITEFYKIPEDCVGLIIGNKGATIRAIQEHSSTQISIQYFKKTSDDAVVAALITGTSVRRNTAKSEICRLIQEKKEKQSKRPLGDKFDNPPPKKNK
jgi:hypothetical protein